MTPPAAEQSAAGTSLRPGRVAASGIAARPEVPPEVMAVVAAAVEEAWSRPRVVVEEEAPGPPAWRFAGRWWSRPASARRVRPWA